MQTNKSLDSLDNFDLEILDLLQRDCTIPQRVIAEKVCLSAPAVQRRVRKLEKNGVIARQVAVLDPSKVGRPLMIIVRVQLESEKPERKLPFYRRIENESAVQQCFSVTGEADYVVILSLRSMEHYEDLAFRLFEGDDNIRHYKTSVVLNKLKYSFRLPLEAEY